MSRRKRVLIVGAGIYGLSLADWLSRMGHEVTIVDRGDARAQSNASSGGTRLLRRTMIESEEYQRFVDVSFEYFQSLSWMEALFNRTGFLLAAYPGARSQRHHSVRDVVQRAAQVAHRAGVEYESLAGSDANGRFGGLKLDPDAAVFWEPSAVTLYVDRIAQAIEDRLKGQSVECLSPVTIRAVSESLDGVVAVAEGGRQFTADVLVVCTGAGDLLQERQARVVQQPVHWYPPLSATLAFPALVVTRPNAPLLFGFPQLDGVWGPKFVHENVVLGPPGGGGRSGLTAWETRLEGALDGAAASVVKGLGASNKRAWSPYALMPGARMVIRRHGQRILRISCCSGHGYKLAPGITRQVAQSIHEGDLDQARLE